MIGGKTLHSWTDNQIKLMEFVARGKKNKNDERRTMQEFADAIGVNRNTLYEWMAMPGWKQDMFELSIARDMDKIPQIKSAVIGKALGQDGFKKVDIPAANLAAKLMGIGSESTKVEMEANVNANVTHHLAGMSDDELEAIIKGAKA